MMPVRMKAVKNIGAIMLLGALGLVTISNPVMGLISGLGLALSCLVRWNSSSVPTTKRRSLTNLWHSLGAYGFGVGVLSTLTIVLGLVVFHSFFTWPIVLFTLLACWLPLLFHFARRDD